MHIPYLFHSVLRGSRPPLKKSSPPGQECPPDRKTWRPALTSVIFHFSDWQTGNVRLFWFYFNWQTKWVYDENTNPNWGCVYKLKRKERGHFRWQCSQTDLGLALTYVNILVEVQGEDWLTDWLNYWLTVAYNLIITLVWVQELIPQPP